MKKKETLSADLVQLRQGSPQVKGEKENFQALLQVKEEEIKELFHQYHKSEEELLKMKKAPFRESIKSTKFSNHLKILLYMM